MELNDKIIKLGEELKGRLEPSMVDYALEYIGYSESALALETLCDYIGDYDILITSDEYSRILSMVDELGLKISARYTYIDPGKVEGE